MSRRLPAGAEEALEEDELLAAEAPEPADAEVAFQGGPAAPAVESRYGEFARTDGAGGDDIVWHGMRFLRCVLPRLSHMRFHFVN